MVSRHFHTNNNKDMITTRRLDLDKILRVFDVRPFVRVKTVADFLVTEGIFNERDRNSAYRFAMRLWSQSSSDRAYH